MKYDVDPEKFLRALRQAEEHKESKCGKISIQCRGKTGNKFMFLIRKESEVIAQLPIEKEFLLNRYCKLGDFMGTDKVRKYLAKKQRKALANSIKSLRAGMNHVNLKAKVLEVAEPTRVVTRYGNIASVAKVLIGDETGTVNLCLWNEQIGGVSVGDLVQIKNAQTSMFRGERLLSLGKKGTLNNEDLKPPLKSMELITAAP